MKEAPGNFQGFLLGDVSRFFFVKIQLAWMIRMSLLDFFGQKVRNPEEKKEHLHNLRARSPTMCWPLCYV